MGRQSSFAVTCWQRRRVDRQVRHACLYVVWDSQSTSFDFLELVGFLLSCCFCYKSKKAIVPHAHVHQIHPNCEHLWTSETDVASTSSYQVAMFDRVKSICVLGSLLVGSIFMWLTRTYYPGSSSRCHPYRLVYTSPHGFFGLKPPTNTHKGRSSIWCRYIAGATAFPATCGRLVCPCAPLGCEQQRCCSMCPQHPILC